jgi:5-(carboxyamino)imidazole ribonucleotide mutase
MKTRRSAKKVKVAIVMGSQSDWKVMVEAEEVLASFGVGSRVFILSAHRTPSDMIDFAKSAREQGFRVIIAGAGGAAHLPGMLASNTTLPVIGVPVPLKAFEGLDSLLSIVQMPNGIPVACVAVGSAHNAALLALQILGSSGVDSDLVEKLDRHRKSLADKVRKSRHSFRKTPKN